MGVLSQYIQEVDEGGLLTKEQEKEILDTFVRHKKDFIQDFLLDPVFSRVLVRIIERRVRLKEEWRLSALITENSPKSERDKIKSVCEELCKALSNQSQKSFELMEKMKASNYLLNTALIDIQNTALEYQHLLKEEARLCQFFNVPNLSKVGKFVKRKSRQRVFDYQGLADHASQDLAEVKFEVAKYFDLIKEKSRSKMVLNSQIANLWERVQPYDKKFKECQHTLVTKNLRLVIKRAKKFQGNGVDLEDLIQEGNIGLMRGIERFEPERDFRVTTYATWWIDQGIRRALSTQGRVIRIPTHVESQLVKYERFRSEYFNEFGKEPSLQDFQEKLGLSEQQVLDLGIYSLNVVDLYISEIESSNVEDDDLNHDLEYTAIVDEESPSPEDIAQQSEMQKLILKSLKKLTPLQEQVIRLRYGIGCIPHNTKEVAEVFGCTKQNIDCVENRAISKMRKDKSVNKLRSDFRND